MKSSLFFLVTLVALPSFAAAKEPSSRQAKARFERERERAAEAAAAATAAVDAERARVAAEAEAAKAKEEAEARAKREAEYVTVRVESNYDHVRFEPLTADQKTVFCGSPCSVRLHAGTSYRALAPGMLGTQPLVVDARSRSIVVRGSSRARHDGGVAATAIGILGMGLGGALLEESTQDDRHSVGTRADLLLSGVITSGIGIAFGITGLVLVGGGSKAEAITSPAAASDRASRPRVLPNGTLAF